MNPWQEQDVKSVFNNGFAMPIYFLIILNIKNQSAFFYNAPKNSLSQMSSTSVQTRKAVKSESLEFWPRFGGRRRKRVYIIASGLGTSTELSWRDSLEMSLMTEREVAVMKGFS